ncbi:Isoleucine--tRNA ligase, mitochondrial, partial [Halocaridina rubra]
MVGLKSALFGDMRCFPYWKLLAEYSSVSSEREATKKYSKSVLLPKTTFPLYVEGKSRVDNERYIQKAAGFSSLYEWQRKQSREEEFVLHDGPPYANGQPHIGHSVNKILKDITLRHKLLRGYKVHYIPGWDCHGLPIELKAMVKDNKSKENILHTAADPIAIRAVARKFAGEALTCQRSSFERWGVLADWNNAYTTNNPEYMSRQLHLFADLYERGYIYQAYKPVHFSPSSRTSLAEAELEYVTDHCSPSVYVAFPTNNLPQVIQDKLSHVKCAKAHIAVWTTTPWTLPANEAVCYAENKLYSLVVIKVKEERVAVVWAKELLKELEEFSAIQSELCTFEGSELSGVTYCHPLSDRECPCLPADHVSMTKGTGLVHTAPVHGHEDFLVALRYKIPL